MTINGRVDAAAREAAIPLRVLGDRGAENGVSIQRREALLGVNGTTQPARKPGESDGASS